jgi:hypothetical protein
MLTESRSGRLGIWERKPAAGTPGPIIGLATIVAPSVVIPGIRLSPRALVVPQRRNHQQGDAAEAEKVNRSNHQHELTLSRHTARQG